MDWNPPIEYELPGVYVDKIVLDSSMDRPWVINENPQPNEDGVPVDGSIAFDIVDCNGVGINLAVTKVYVRKAPATAWTLALDNSVFQPGFDGPDSAITNPYGVTRRIVIDPTTDFESLQMVEVNVHTATTDGAILEVDYHFHADDIEPPALLSALATARRVVRLTFSEDVLQEDATGAHDALNPTNYTFVPLDVPAVPLVAVSVEHVSAHIVDVYLDTDMTWNTEYRVTATSVEDTEGNPIVPPNNTATFIGFQPQQSVGRSWDLWRMLPEKNRREDTTEDLRKFIRCLQEVDDQLLADVDAWTNILDVDLAAEQWIDRMLVGLGNPFGYFELDLLHKRMLVRLLVPIYRLKGTGPGIIAAVRFFLGIEVTIFTPWSDEVLVLGESELDGAPPLEWSLGSGIDADLYTFEIHSLEELTDTQRAQIRFIADYMKSPHEHYSIVEPSVPPVPPDHVELGLSELGEEWYLH